LSKANNIRKKALEYARRQDWESAIREYRRLAEIDRSNPNIHNELGDIYIKVGEKSEAYQSFATAIDAYARVSLFNNAVAVCKKVLRIVPARYEVQAKLGCIRKKQGLAKEAESYCLQYLERLSQDPKADAREIARTAEAIAESMADCAVVLDRLTETLFNAGLDQEAAQVLVRLHKLYATEGIKDAGDEVRKRLESLGMGHLIQSAPTVEKKEPVKEGPVITEENIWTDSLSEGERISVENAAQSETADAAPMAKPSAADADPYEYREVSLTNGDTEHAPSTPDTPVHQPPKPASAAPFPPTAKAAKPRPYDPDIVMVSSIIDGSNSDGAGSVDRDDYRSHYDLGMAYLEMNLFAEAVREFQLASKSREFLVKSLEMVGLCFLKQDQAQLAIKQLNKGLSQIDANDVDALGIKYNLGLAYEMVGDDEKAQALFEDVYVVDITFRDVALKVARYSQR